MLLNHPGLKLLYNSIAILVITLLLNMKREQNYISLYAKNPSIHCNDTIKIIYRK